MKTASAKTIGFGFSAVNAGQRNTSAEPQLIAVSTEGNFRITPAVSKALGVGHGEYIAFLSNVDNIDAAILEKNEVIVEFCEANGLEVGSPEAAVAIHQEFDAWMITKGYVEYDPKGNQKVTSERLTKNDKLKFVSQNFDAMLENAMEEGDAETQDALSRDGITKEEQMDILAGFVIPRELPKYKGSKLANPAAITGPGSSLTFTDSNVWKQLKVDLGDDATSVNRVFEINIEELQDVVLSDGFKDITIKALALGEYTDKEPSRIGSKDEE